jgi:hypothetical protein
MEMQSMPGVMAFDFYFAAILRLDSEAQLAQTIIITGCGWPGAGG